MRIEETRWIAERLNELKSPALSVLNIGSSTLHFRKKVQPHIEEVVFKPLYDQNIKVIHCDIRNDEGVDLVGNIIETDFEQKVKNLNFNIIICSNVLEHVENVSPFCNALENVMPKGGYLIITVPNIYPYHNDPIDTKFRPNIEEVSELFPHCKTIKGTILKSKECHFITLLKHPYSFMLTLKNWVIPRFGLDDFGKRWSDIPNLFKRYKMTCILFQKI